MVDVLYRAPDGIGTGSVKGTHFEQGSGAGSIGSSVPETGDRTGQAVGASTTTSGGPFLVTGAPGEAIGTDVGNVITFRVAVTVVRTGSARRGCRIGVRRSCRGRWYRRPAFRGDRRKGRASRPVPPNPPCRGQCSR
ncbi:hypothetical protein QZN11_04145 [Streptomyces gramineus]|uniref:hypothetical protein n=1 Tax=Streptomyces gramineus TaxID=910542 RepID=UPI00398B57A1